MQLLYLFESVRNPVCDAVMSAVTYLGHEFLFLAAALIFFWCIDRRTGYYLISVGLIGAAGNQLLKIIFRVPRPWELDPAFSIVENARSAATGYSFPSGHTQSAVGTFGCFFVCFRDRRVRIPAAAALLLVPISRMYLGVHTPYDVGVSFVLALLLVVLLRPVLTDSRFALRVFLLSAAVCVCDLLFVTLYRFPADTDPGRLTDAVSNAFKLTGAAFGILHTAYRDGTCAPSEVRAVWWAQLLKTAGGIAALLLVRSLCKVPLNLLFSFLPGSFARCGDLIRYYLVSVTAGILWPMTFPFFSRLGWRTEQSGTDPDRKA